MQINQSELLNSSLANAAIQVQETTKALNACSDRAQELATESTDYVLNDNIVDLISVTDNGNIRLEDAKLKELHEKEKITDSDLELFESLSDLNKLKQSIEGLVTKSNQIAEGLRPALDRAFQSCNRQVRPLLFRLSDAIKTQLSS